MPIDLRSKTSGGGGTELGQFVELSKNFPPIVDLGVNRYLKNGFSTPFENVDESIWYITDLIFSSISNTFGTSTIASSASEGSTFIAVGQSGKAARSTDSGLTWTSIDVGFDTTQVASVYVSNGTWIAVGASAKISRSVDDGITWTPILSGQPTSVAFNCVTEVDGVWVAFSAGDDYSRSTDDGLTWDALTQPVLVSGARAIASSNGVLVASSGGDNQVVAARSTDLGLTWTAVNNLDGVSGGGYSVASENGVFVLGVRTTTSGELLRSDDGGVNFTTVETGYDIRTLTTENGIWLGGGTQGNLIRSSDNGATWTEIESQFGTTAILGSTTSEGTWLLVGSSGKMSATGNMGFSIADESSDTKYMRIK